MDPTYRGVRLTYNNTYRVATCVMCSFLLLPAAALFFWPGLFSDKPRMEVLALKIGWLGILVVIFLAPLQAFRDFLIVNDDGLIKSNLIGRQTRLQWTEISEVLIDFDGNDITFRTSAGDKLKASRAYNGWRDFLETSARHFAPDLQARLALALEEQTTPHADLQAIPRDRGI